MDWTPLERAFEDNFRSRDERGAGVAVWCGRTDRPLCSIHEGWVDRERSARWSRDTLCPIWSATKGIAAWCLLQALKDDGMDSGQALADLWPELGAARAVGGANPATVADVLHHRVGLPAIDAVVNGLDHAAVCRALERQSAEWTPGTDQGYHARTFGWLVDELVRRVSGAESIGDFWEQRLRRSQELECWIGLPRSEHARVARVVPGKWTPGHANDPFYSRLTEKGSLQSRAFRSPEVAARVSDITEPQILEAGLAALGGVATSESLARFYARLAMDPGRMTVPGSSRDEDRVLLGPMAYRDGFMTNFPTERNDDRGGGKRLFGAGGDRFGYPGAGGVVAFADPGRRIGFAYVMNQMELRVLPGEKARHLLAAVDQVFRSTDGDVAKKNNLED